MRLLNIWDRFGIIILTGIIFIIFSLLTSNILKPANLINLLIQSSVIAIAGAGMTLAITVGGFDLSIGSILALTTCIMAKLVPIYGLIITTIIAIIISIFCGLLNGLLITKIKIQTFVATLATMIIFQGIALIYTEGRFIPLFDFPEIKIFTVGRLLGIPIPLIILVITYILIYFIYKFTPLGIYIRGIGSNKYAATTSGIPVDTIIIIVFILTALTSAISGIIVTSQLLTGGAVYGTNFALEVITITILGGTSLSGGKGFIWGTLMAAIMIGTLQNGLNLLGFSQWIQQFIEGIVLLIALSIGGTRVIITSKTLNNSNSN